MKKLLLAAVVFGGIGLAAPAHAEPKPLPSREDCILELMRMNGHYEWLSPECKIVLGPQKVSG